jgi:pimeloyl-ACP methyl ester carboxylesterase
MPDVESHDATIYYETHGDPDAPALVLAHGAGGNRLIWWQQVPHVARDHRLVVIDHRSFGRSRCASEAFQPRHFADDLAAVLDAEGIARAAIVGQSMGGWTALGLARRSPERVRALVMCGTPGGIWTLGVRQAMMKMGERLRDGVQANDAFAPDYAERNPAMAHLYSQVSDLNTGVDTSTLTRLFLGDVQIEQTSLKDLRTPTLVIAGEHDQLFPLPVMREIASLLPGAELQEFVGCGHSTYFESPERFNSIVSEFVAKHP